MCKIRPICCYAVYFTFPRQKYDINVTLIKLESQIQYIVLAFRKVRHGGQFMQHSKIRAYLKKP